MTNPGDESSPATSRHHRLSEKYPSAPDPPYPESLERFVRDVSRTLKRSYPRTSSGIDHYDKAHCLFLRWEEDDLGTQAEIDELRPLIEGLCFTDSSESFTTDQYTIPSEDSFDSLEVVLVNKRAQFAKTSRDLLIIYYGGHGEVNKNRQCIWYPWLRPPPGFYDNRPELDWTILQDRLRRCEGNILFILDCCYASSMVGRSYTAWNGFKELLVASGKHEKTDGVNDNSFTRALIQELKALKSEALSINALQATMIENQETHGLKNTPLRIGLSERANRFESLLLVPSQSQSDTPAVRSVDVDTIDDGTRVLITIRLRNPADALRVKEWIPWLQRQAPKAILDMGVSLSQAMPS